MHGSYFPAETQILCRDGFKPITAVAVGDPVLTHLGRWQPVTARSTGTTYSIRLRGMGHPGLYTSNTEAIWATRATRERQPCSLEYPNGTHRRRFVPPTWLPAAQAVGAYWASPATIPALPIPSMEVQKRERALDAEHPSLWWIIGAWLGRGSLMESQSSNKSTSATEKRIHIPLSVHQILQVNEHAALLGLPEVYSEAGAPYWKASSRPLFRWIAAHFGRGVDGKQLPVWALGAPAPLRQALLDGFLTVEGELMYPRRGIRIASVNQCLLLGIKILAQTLNRSAAWCINTPQAPHYVAGKLVSGERPTGFVSLNPQSASVEIGLHRFAKVRAIEQADVFYSGYALHVANDQSYVANGIVVKSLPA